MCSGREPMPGSTSMSKHWPRGPRGSPSPGGELLQAAGELHAAPSAAAAAVGHAGAGGAVGQWGGTWSRSLAALGDATARTGGNLGAAARAYQETDTTAMPR